MKSARQVVQLQASAHIGERRSGVSRDDLWSSELDSQPHIGGVVIGQGEWSAGAAVEEPFTMDLIEEGIILPRRAFEARSLFESDCIGRGPGAENARVHDAGKRFGV